MYHFIGICVNYGQTYYRIFDSGTKTAADISKDMLIRLLMSDKEEPIRNIGFNRNGDIVGTCGSLSNYGIQNNDTRQLKNAYIIVFKRNKKYVLVDMNARLYYLNELETVVLNESTGIANAKVVTRNGRSYICAISGTFETDGITDELVEKRNKYLSMADSGRLSNRNLKRLDKASQELDLREKGYRDSLRGKIGPNISDRMFMRPVTYNLNNIEKTSDNALIDVKTKLAKNRLQNISKVLKILNKKTENRGSLEQYEIRFKMLEKLYEDIENIRDDRDYQKHELINILESLMNRANTLYSDLVEVYTDLTVKA